MKERGCWMLLLKQVFQAAEDVTSHIIPSARLLGESCRAKLQTAEPVSNIALKNRQASVAFYDLLTSNDLGYFFVSTVKR